MRTLGRKKSQMKTKILESNNDWATPSAFEINK